MKMMRFKNQGEYQKNDVYFIINEVAGFIHNKGADTLTIILNSGKEITLWFKHAESCQRSLEALYDEIIKRK